LAAVAVCRIAQHEGGGGHRFAAGFTSDDTAEEVGQRILAALP
jgi:nanoRNase/pAp phosphatase (c-di-AMP/oligoRNAs hydrolase)